MMETQKLILYVALGLVLMLLWQSWLNYSQPPPIPATGISSSDPSNPSTPVNSEDSYVPSAPSNPDQPAKAQELETVESVGATVEVITDLYRVTIGTVGADIRKVELLDYPLTVENPDEPLALMVSELPDLFYVETGLLGRDFQYPNHKTEFVSSKSEYILSGSDGSLDVAFEWSAPDGVIYKKIYKFLRNSYEIDINYEIVNKSGSVWNGYQYSQFVRTLVEEEGSLGFLGRLPSYKGGAIFTPEEKFEKYDFGDMVDEDLKRVTESGWVSMLQHYFVGAWLPQQEGPYEFYSSVANANTNPIYRIGYKTLTPTVVEPGTTGSMTNRIFIGPKEQDRLAEAAEGMKLTIDYGWLTIVSAPLFVILNWFFKVLGNWGWAIIFLTLLIKLVFFPLSAASYKSMAKMKNLQPRMKTLKERYGEDRQKFQQEMMKIYKEEKINPLGGCLPILIQIPVFIALYWVLLESVELRQANWFWLTDLSVQDPFYILPIIMGVSMILQQKLNPAPMDEMQKKIMMALPFVFTIFFLFFPSGLVLYWVVNNILSIAQQWVITKKITENK